MISAMAECNILITMGKMNIKVYARRGMCILVCNFLPFSTRLIHVIEQDQRFEIERVQQYNEVDMGVIILKGSRSELVDYLNKVDIINGEELEQK